MADSGLVSALALGVAVGAAAGAAYFAGLWWTVQRAIGARAPARWLLASFALRAALVAALFWLVAGHSAAGLAGCLAGFVAARLVATRRLRADPEDAPCG